MTAALETFQGYRVQHHLTLGPTKGGTRFAPSRHDGRSRRARHVDELEMRAGEFALRRSQRRRRRAIRTKLSRNELEAVSRRYMQEMIPFVGPHTDIMGPDMGTNEQVMAWFMDTYSVYQGYCVNEIVTGKPVSIGGTEGRREATGRGVVYLIERAMDVLKMNPDNSTAIVQGFGNVGAVAALSLALKTGMKVVGISDATVRFTIRNGIDIAKAEQHVAQEGQPSRLRRSRPDRPRRASHHAVRRARALRGRSRDQRQQRRQIPLPHPRRRRERPDHSRGRSHPQRALG